ncbi:MAG: hotdog fold thioesterase, partial [Sphingobacteriia bacterium]|nr:hotdog fold thioesterase [Sphingobacteriia bacterium]
MTSEEILATLQNSMQGNMGETLGMEIIHAEMGQIQGRMPVDHRTKQPFGLLHGGASVALAETLGSIGANMLAYPDKHAVGMEINANHLRPVSKGYVTG